MTKQTYICRRFPSVGAFEYRADFSQSAGNIMVRFNGDEFDGDDDGWQPVPFQIADCGHSRSRAEQMIAGYFR